MFQPSDTGLIERVIIRNEASSHVPKMLTFQWSVVPDEKGVLLCEALTCTAA